MYNEFKIRILGGSGSKTLQNNCVQKRIVSNKMVVGLPYTYQCVQILRYYNVCFKYLK